MTKRTILVRAPNHLGDCVMARVALAAVHRLYPKVRFGVIAPEPFVALFRDLPNISRVATIPGSETHGVRSFVKVFGVAREAGSGTTCSVNLTASFASTLALRLGGRGYCHQYKAPQRHSPLMRHRAQAYAGLFLRSLGCVGEVSTDQLLSVAATFQPSSIATETASALLRKHGVSSSAALVAIAPQAVAPSRRWGAKRYGELAEKICGENKYTIILIGSPAERGAGAEVAAHCSAGIHNLCGETTVEVAAALLRGARVMVGDDSGLAHLAAAVGTPLVTLWGAGNPVETSPFSSRKTAIYKQDLPCISCVKNDCPLQAEEYMACMTTISVAEVLAAAKAVLASGKP